MATQPNDQDAQWRFLASDPQIPKETYSVGVRSMTEWGIGEREGYISNKNRVGNVQISGTSQTD